MPINFKTEGLNFEYTGSNGLLLEEIPNFKFTPFEEGLKELYIQCKNILNKV